MLFFIICSSEVLEKLESFEDESFWNWRTNNYSFQCASTKMKASTTHTFERRERTNRKLLFKGCHHRDRLALEEISQGGRDICSDNLYCVVARM